MEDKNCMSCCFQKNGMCQKNPPQVIPGSNGLYEASSFPAVKAWMVCSKWECSE